MNLAQVKQDIESWIETFVEVPHPALGNWPPCPYARHSRLNGTYEVRLGSDPYIDLRTISTQGLNNKEVIIIAYDPNLISHEEFSAVLDQANRELLLPCDILALEDHPSDPEWVNGVCMNQGTYALALVQSLSDLDLKAKKMAGQGFYHHWPAEYLDQLFQHRKDPRR